MQPEEAFQALRRGRSSQWDAALVEVFIEMMRREGDGLIIPNGRPVQLAVSGLLERPMLVQVDARD